MKLRIRENSIRLRLTQGEVAQFAETGLVECKTEFQGEKAFKYSVSICSDDKALTASFDNGCIDICVPQAMADRWTTTDEVGIEGADGLLTIMIEKDFACLTVREGEDESDAFPHPEQDKIHC